MSESNVKIATSTGKSGPHSVTFEVSEFILENRMEWLGSEWSEPVRLRFEKHDHDEQWDLVMQVVESA